MRKNTVIAGVAGIAALWCGAAAVADEYEVRNFMSGVSTVLPLGEGVMRVNYDSTGVMHCLSGDCPEPPMWTINCVGSMLIMSGRLEAESGNCRNAHSDGSEMFSRYEASGELGKPIEGTYSYIGGTGRFEGVTGGGTWVRTSLGSVKDGTAQSTSLIRGSNNLN